MDAQEKSLVLLLAISIASAQSSMNGIFSNPEIMEWKQNLAVSERNDHQYFLADGGQTCSEACGNREGSCNLEAIQHVASDVSLCKETVEGLGKTTGKQGRYKDDNSGCTYHPGQDGWAQVYDYGNGTETTCDARNSDGSRQRVCSCAAPLPDCSCSDKTNKQFGNCDTNGWYRHGPLCYVKEPSHCHDLVTDGSHYPEGYSWEACEPKGKDGKKKPLWSEKWMCKNNIEQGQQTQLRCQEMCEGYYTPECVGISYSLKTYECFLCLDLILTESDKNKWAKNDFGEFFEMPKPVHCEWDEWVLGDCSATCGVGTRTNARTKLREEAYRGTCTGQDTQTQQCQDVECPVHCEWGPFEIGECSLPCGSGMRTNIRVHNVSAEHEGEECEGPDSVEENCNTHECPVDCTWTSWMYQECSTTCGEGTVAKTRSMNTEMFGGLPCEGSLVESEPCNVQDCPTGFVYTLYGMIGDEEVTVTENGVESSLDPPLLQSTTEYGTESPKIVIDFKNDNGQRDVFFHSNSPTIIKGPLSGNTYALWDVHWKCGSLNENPRCGRVRKGVFAWSGIYEIKFDVFKLSMGEGLQSGQSLLSENGLYTLAVQTDGNIVLEKGEDVLWASGTHGKGTAPYMMTMQKDNHLVLRDADSEIIWKPDVYIGKDGNNWAAEGYAVLQTDGNFVVYDGDAKAMWATDTQKGQQGSTDGGIWKGDIDQTHLG